MINTQPIIPEVYSDINPRLGQPGQFNEKVINTDSIREALITLITTPVGSRVFNRAYGCRAADYVGDPLVSGDTVFRIKSSIEVAIRDWEPRVTNVQTTVGYDEDLLAYYISLSYTIPALNGISDVLTFNVK